MGRRALPQIDPKLDLSRYLKTVEDLPQPFRADALFENDAPLEVEVGSGKGLFLASASGDHPDRNFLGCEIARKYARFAAAKLDRLERRNALMVQGDANRLFSEFLPDASVIAVHVYFPDPWWKHRHRKRRIINDGFVRQIQRVLKPQGRLHFWTDVPEYFESALKVIARSSDLQGPIPVEEQPAEHDLDYRTHFERRMRMHGVGICRAEFVRP